jgi:hypothetical protein
MTVTLNDPVSIGDGAWYVSWTTDQGDGTECFVYVNGDLYVQGPLLWTIVALPLGGGDETLHIEVLDAIKEDYAIVGPTVATLAWYSVTGTAYYTVEEYVDAAWTEKRRIQDRGEGYFRWDSRVLEDVTTHQFRVTAVGTNGNASAVAARTILIVRSPDRPDVTYAYSNATEKVTISAA